MATSVYIVADNTTSAIYCTQIVGDGGGYSGSYDIASQPFSIIELPDGTDPSPYMGTKFLGAASSLLVSGVGGYDPAAFLTNLELPPGGLGTANWDGSVWRSIYGNVPTGSLILEPGTVSESNLSVYAGGNIDIDCNYTCTDPTATVTYSWTNAGGLPIVGANTATLSLSGLTEAYTGTYYCLVAATNPDLDFGAVKIGFTLTVYPTI